MDKRAVALVLRIKDSKDLINHQPGFDLASG